MLGAGPAAPTAGTAAIRRARVRGAGLEFQEYRHYEPGDDPRSIDWTVEARLRQLVVRVARADGHVRLHVLLDASASMGVGRPDKWSCARSLAAALCYVAQERRDTAGLAVFDNGVRAYIAPAAGRAQLFRALSLIDTAVPHGPSRHRSRAAALRSRRARARARGGDLRFLRLGAAARRPAVPPASRPRAGRRAGRVARRGRPGARRRHRARGRRTSRLAGAARGRARDRALSRAARGAPPRSWPPTARSTASRACAWCRTARSATASAPCRAPVSSAPTGNACSSGFLPRSGCWRSRCCRCSRFAGGPPRACPSPPCNCGRRPWRARRPRSPAAHGGTGWRCSRRSSWPRSSWPSRCPSGPRAAASPPSSSTRHSA